MSWRDRPAAMYWRGPTLGHFDGATWRPVRRELGRAPRPEVDVAGGGRTLRYRTTLEPHSRRWLFALDVPVELPRAQGLKGGLVACLGLLL